MQPLVSIIIPTFNNQDFIVETLESVISQSYTYWEAIIVDDGSEDQTKQIIEDYSIKDSRLKYFVRPETRPKGANACRNYGIEQVNGDYIVFLDADDIFDEGCLQNRLELFNTVEYDLVIADTALIKNGLVEKKSINKDPGDNDSNSYLKLFLEYQLPWTIMSVLWKKEIVISNRFDENLFRFQDIDFHIYILKNDYKIGRLKRIDNYYRVDPHKIKDKEHIHSVLKNLLIFYNKHIESIIDHNEQRLAFQKFVNYFLFQYVFPNYISFKHECDMFLEQVYGSHLYTNKQLQFIKTYAFLVKIKLHRTKYLGMYTFSKFIKRKLDNP